MSTALQSKSVVADHALSALGTATNQVGSNMRLLTVDALFAAASHGEPMCPYPADLDETRAAIATYPVPVRMEGRPAFLVLYYFARRAQQGGGGVYRIAAPHRSIVVDGVTGEIVMNAMLSEGGVISDVTFRATDRTRLEALTRMLAPAFWLGEPRNVAAADEYLGIGLDETPASVARYVERYGADWYRWLRGVP